MQGVTKQKWSATSVNWR